MRKRPEFGVASSHGSKTWARSRRGAAWLAMATATVLVAAACSSSSSNSSSSTTSSGGSATSGATAGATAAATGTPIVIGSIGDLSGADILSADANEPKESMQAWVDWTNAHGGINGHPVQLIYLDDGSDPARGLADARKLVENYHVVAIVGQESLSTLPGWASYVQQAGIPVIGGQPYSAPATNPMMFMTATSDINLVAGQPSLVQFVHKHRFAVFYSSDLTVAVQSLAETKKIAAKEGLDLVYTAGVTAVEPNYSAQCLAAKGANAEFVLINLPPTTDAQIVTNCSQQGYNPVYGNIVSATPSTLALPGVQGAVGNIVSFPYFYNVPATTEFHQAIAQYAPGIGSRLSLVSTISWASGVVFGHAASMVKGPITPKSLVAALYTIKNDTFGGLTPPVSYGPAGQSNPAIACYYIVQINNHQFVAPNGLQTQCANP